MMDDGFEPPYEFKGLYRPGGLHPIEIGQFIDHRGRFEVCHKYAHGREFTQWYTKDHVQQNWKLVKVFTADTSDEKNPELEVARTLKKTPRKVLNDNHIVVPSEHFWIDGPNGRHLCLVLPVLDPRHPLEIISRGNPDKLIDVCFQVATAVAFLHKRGICHRKLEQKNVQFFLDTKTFEEKVRTVKDLNKYLGEPYFWPLEIEKDDLRPNAPRDLVTQGYTSHAGFVCEDKKVGLVGFEDSYEPELFFSTPEAKHLSKFPVMQHPADVVRDGAGIDGFPSDIWSLACLFGEIRTEDIFWRDPEDYGTPVSMEEIKNYLKSRSYRVGVGVSSIQWDDFDLSSDDAESFEESDINTSEENPVVGTREQAPPTVPDILPEEPKEKKSKKKTEIHIERRVTRSMTRMQQSNLSESNPTHVKKHDIVKPQEPAKKSKISSRISKKVPKEKTRTKIGQVEPKEKGPEREVSSTGRNTPRNQEADAAEIPTPQDEGIKLGASSVHSEGQENVSGNSVVTPASISQDTLKKGHRSDIIVKDEEPYGTTYYEMPEDERDILADLLKKMLDPNPEDRPTIEEVLNHEWFGDRRTALAPKSE